MGGNNSQTVVDISDVDIKMHDGIIRPIRNIRYVPNLRGILEDEEHTFKSNNNTLKIVMGSLAGTKGPKRNGLYLLVGDIIISQDSSMFIVTENKSCLLHSRIGHIGNKGLKS